MHRVHAAVAEASGAACGGSGRCCSSWPAAASWCAPLAGSWSPPGPPPCPTGPLLAAWSPCTCQSWRCAGSGRRPPVPGPLLGGSDRQQVQWRVDGEAGCPSEEGALSARPAGGGWGTKSPNPRPSVILLPSRRLKGPLLCCLQQSTPSPCSFLAVKTITAVSSPTMHSATLRGCPLGPRGRSTTTCAWTTWAGAKGRGQRPSQDRFGWLSWPGQAWGGPRGDAGQPQEHLDVEVVPVSPWPEVCHLLEHGGTLFCCHSGCAVSACSRCGVAGECGDTQRERTDAGDMHTRRGGQKKTRCLDRQVLQTPNLCPEPTLSNQPTLECCLVLCAILSRVLLSESCFSGIFEIDLRDIVDTRHRESP